MTVPALMLPHPQGRRIGLFGGSFNPAHDGHMALAREALRRLSLDQVWWMVSPQNPLKDPRDTGDFSERFAAAKALASHRRMVVLDVESRLDSRTTAETLRKLAPVFRRGRFVWIMGADSFAGLHRWNDWQFSPGRSSARQRSPRRRPGCSPATGSRNMSAGACPIWPRRPGRSSKCDCGAKARPRFATVAGGQQLWIFSTPNEIVARLLHPGA
jgi:nicotinamide mononucleotide adenylyltransferase